MSRPDPAVIVTGILYVVVAMVAAAGFFKVEYSPGRFSADAMAGNTASMALLWAFCLLQLSSLALGAVLIMRRRPSAPMLWLAGALVCVGLWWHWLAGLLWLVPLPLLWRAVRQRPGA